MASDQVGNHFVRARPAQLVINGRGPGLIRETLNRDEVAALRSELHGHFVELGFLVIREGIFVESEMNDDLSPGLIIVDVRDHIAQVIQILRILIGLGHRALRLIVGGLRDFVGGGQLLLVLIDGLIGLAYFRDLR